MVHAACEALGVPILTSERYEADDVIGTLTVKAAAAGFDVAIVTGDKDFFQLVRDGIRVFNPRDEGTWYDADGVKEKFGVTPDQVVDVLALMGDTIDNIKGVPGIGEKGARELIATYGSLEKLLAHAAEIKQKRYREAAARQRRSRPARAASWRAFAPTCRSSSIPRRFGIAGASRETLLPDLQRARRSARSSPSTRRPPAPPPRPTGSSTRAKTSRRWRPGSSAAGRFALRVVADRPSGDDARRSSASRFRRRARDADYVPTGHRGARAPLRRLPLEAALAALKPVLEDAAIEKVGHDLKFDAIVLARHGVTLRGSRHRHDARELSARRHAIGAPARGPRARAHQLQGADRGGRLRPRRQGGVAGGRAGRGGGRLRGRARRPGRPARAAVSAICSKKDSSTSVYTTLELPLIPVLVAVERAGVRIDGPALAAQSQQVEQELAQRTAQIFAAGRRRVQHQFAQAARRDPVRQAAAAGAEADRHVARAVDRGRSARGAGARARSAAPDSRVARADEAEGHLHRRAAAARQSGDRPRPHLLQPGGRGHRPPEQQRSEPAEHPDPHRARPRDPPRLHRRTRPRADLGRLLADRAARAGASRRATRR